MPKKFTPRTIPAFAATADLLGHNASFQRIVTLNTQIREAEQELATLVAEVNKQLSNPLFRDTAKTYAKKHYIRMADRFEVSPEGQLYLVCEKAPAEAPPLQRKPQTVPTLVSLRERAKKLGVNLDSLKMGRQRRKIVAYLDQLEASKTKMTRTGDAVPVAVVG